VDLPKDQQVFDRTAEAHVGTCKVPVSPITTGLPGDPQKTHAPLPEGPEFDFTRPEVAAREQSLREVAAELKAGLAPFAVPPVDEAGYLALQTALGTLLPRLYDAYDAYVGAVLSTGNESVTCARGCSHCCRHYVTSVEPYELLFMHARVRGDQRYPSRVIGMHRRAALFHSLRDGRGGDEAEDRALHRYYLRDQPCPFLEANGACGAYAARPMSCRMYYSLSHPSLCKGKAVIAPGNRNFLIELPEDIEADIARAGAHFASYGLPESLFEGLLAVNESVGRFDPIIE
jgi:Fe-S-cluster containining protein